MADIIGKVPAHTYGGALYTKEAYRNAFLFRTWRKARFSISATGVVSRFVIIVQNESLREDCAPRTLFLWRALARPMTLTA